MSPWGVLEVARDLPVWDPEGNWASLGPVVRNVRADLLMLVAGERGANVARAAFNHRRADPQDPEKRPDFDGIPAQERASLASLAGLVQAEALSRGIIQAGAGGAGVRETRRGS